MSKLINLSLLSRFWTKTKNYIDTALSGKVSAETGKGLSTNDLTNSLKGNYDAAYSHSQDDTVHVTAAQKTAWNAKAAGDHTHTPAEIGAAAASHTHDYAPSEHTHTGFAATSHSHAYADLTGKPTIPTAVSQLSDASLYALKSDLSSVYKYKGSVATVEDLPTSGNTVGDIYNVEASGMNYAWNGTEWDALGSSLTIETATEAEIDALFA